MESERGVLEVADIEVRPGAEDDFAAAYRSVRGVLTGTPGCQSVRMTRGVETPTRFVLLVEWESVAAHEENFRNSERFVAWRGGIGPFFARPPRVEDFTDFD
jgi:heme-degrading monooxygenase HmoA